MIVDVTNNRSWNFREILLSVYENTKYLEGEVERVCFVSKSSSARSCASFIDPFQPDTKSE